MDKRTDGWASGFVGVLIFSGSLPATRAAVMDFDPLFLTVARAAIAGVLAATLLHETVTPLMLATTLVVILCVAGARRFAT